MSTPSTDDRAGGIGIDHPTVVPKNFDAAGDACPECGHRTSEE